MQGWITEFLLAMIQGIKASAKCVSQSNELLDSPVKDGGDGNSSEIGGCRSLMVAGVGWPLELGARRRLRWK
ncbi:hypothetical protein ACS0TY_030829 [Phlomoides rotata]